MLYGSSPLSLEVLNIHDNNLEKVVVSHVVTIHTEEADYYPKDLIDIQVLRDYDNNLSDYVIVSILLPMGEYLEMLYPERDNLNLTVVQNRNGKITKVTYKGVVINDEDGIVNGKNNSISTEDMDSSEMLNISIQCVDLVYESLRMKLTTGMYRSVTLEDTIITALKREIGNISIDDTTLDVNINIYPPHNQRVYGTIELLDDMTILDIPTYLQSKYGIYNGGIGVYIQNIDEKYYIFIYPLYNASVINDTNLKKMRLYFLNSMVQGMIDKTCVVENDEVKILSGGEMSMITIGETEITNSGAGFNVSNSNTVVDRAYEVSSDGVVIMNNTDNRQHQTIKNKKDGFTPTVAGSISDNLYKERSRIMFNVGKRLQVQWKFSVTNLLYPGMPVEFKYLNRDKEVIKEIGILNSTYTVYNESKQMPVTILNIFVGENDEDDTQ